MKNQMLTAQLSLCICLLLCGNLLSQSNGSPPLGVKIALIKAKNSPRVLTIKAEITNISKEKIIIDKNSIGYATSFYSGNGSLLLQNEISSAYEGNYLVLSPNESYEEVMKIELTDDFFADEKEYRMSIYYGQFLERSYEDLVIWRGTVESNQILFCLRNKKIRKCKE
ncbi:MAG: hypothetical protein R2684_03035 [Pyrinomonadaceae bacterium]